ncbi:MAG: ATP-binding protein [Bradymonadaceae bacterium]|nr:ATP-binding protein [Lujinxingiaceae bacterium]
MKPDVIYDGVVHNLVNQFSSALDCFRELVQNSIDAGTPRVDVWMEFTPGTGHEGIIAIHVDDYGEGMDEAVIDNQFTQLFASSKENDLTKIGKFGIGFVSVFALLPHAILVHTGKNGEYWEVFFHTDRTFTKTRLELPVEGTQLTLFLSGDYARYMELAVDIPKTLRRWCNHSDIDVTFEDRHNNRNFAPPELINEPFEVVGDCMQHIMHQGSEIVVAYTERPIYGYYNRGLTLALTAVGDDILGHRNQRYGRIGFKIKSRYLEHTLARESVMRDEHYEKAMALVDEAANGPLFEALVAKIEELVAQPRWDVRDIASYDRLLSYLFDEPDHNLRRCKGRAIIRLVDGTACSLERVYEVFRRDGRVLISSEQNNLSARLQAGATPVVLGQRTRAEGALSVVRPLLERAVILQSDRTVVGTMARYTRMFGEIIGSRMDFFGLDQTKSAQWFALPESVYIAVGVDEEVPESIAELLKGAEALLNQCSTGYRRLSSAVMLTPMVDPPFFVVASKLGPLMAQPPASVQRKENERLEAAVNRNHPNFEAIRIVYEHDAAMGIYFLAKALLLKEDRLLDRDAQLIAAALSETAASFRAKS